jgi:plastocyanin
MKIPPITILPGLACMLFGALAAHAGDIHGIVQVADGLTKKRIAPAEYQVRGSAMLTPATGAIDEMARVIVYLEGAIGEPRPITAEIVQRNRQFEPAMLAAPQGSTISFPNSDSIFHNVFSLSKLKSFDLGYYSAGNTRTVRFDKPGVVQVYCHLHADMSALIIVTPNRYYAHPASAGTFQIPGVPAGTYSIVAWHKSGRTIRKNIVVPEDGSVDVEFKLPSSDLAAGK